MNSQCQFKLKYFQPNKAEAAPELERVIRDPAMDYPHLIYHLAVLRLERLRLAAQATGPSSGILGEFVHTPKAVY